MTEKELIQFCHYYKGQSKNPYEGHPDSALAPLWDYERTWVRDTISAYNSGSSILTSYLDEYLDAGLREFAQFDNTPATLKALLFNRYAKTYQTMRDAVDGFKKFYSKYYK